MVHPVIPPGAERPNLLNGLVHKRAQVAGHLQAAEAERQRLMGQLRSLDATIHLLEPGIDLGSIAPKPPPMRVAASRGQITKIVLRTLRDAGRPLTSQECTREVLLERGLDCNDPTLARLLRARVTACLRTKRRRGLVQATRLEDAEQAWEIIR